jgi:hypothetical protein
VTDVIRISAATQHHKPNILHCTTQCVVLCYSTYCTVQLNILYCATQYTVLCNSIYRTAQLSILYCANPIYCIAQLVLCNSTYCIAQLSIAHCATQHIAFRNSIYCIAQLSIVYFATRYIALHYCWRWLLLVSRIRPLACSNSQLTATTRTLWKGNRHIAKPLPTQANTTQENTRIYVPGGIRTHDPSICMIQNHTLLIPLGHWD